MLPVQSRFQVAVNERAFKQIPFLFIKLNTEFYKVVFKRFLILNQCVWSKFHRIGQWKLLP